MAVAIVMCVVFYFRPGEPLGLRACQLVPPLAGGRAFQRRWALVQRPMELGRPSKTNRWGDSRMLDLDDRQFLAPVLARLRGPGEGSERKLFGFDYPTWAREHRRASLGLGLGPVGPPTLHGLRRAGACLGCALGRRAVLEIKHRGNWAAPNPVRRYQKAGRLVEQLHQLSPGARQAALQCAAQIGGILAGRWLS
ncbi:unnamed protein product [Prorocentrum cordatum]|uniref:Uncharacterized protein n=1 Tax=Prorocentrum cordatum TaxID=2364126 RepID=A0ABN9QA98_9DINO|nr:unnamed protein product [Polarella glacialis]